jgi:phosphatidate phosphatase APP1
MQLITYYGYIENKKVLVSGRLIYNHIRVPKANDTTIRNIKDMIKRYFAIGMPGRKIKIILGEETKTVKTNNYGRYQAHFEYKKNGPKKYTAQYREEKKSNKIFLPKKEETAIISDVDDTFLVTHSTSYIKRMWTSATKNHNTRSSVEDIIDIYKDFSGPIFYVSNSQWRLYDLLEGFREINKMPQGPFLLRGKSKYSRIKSILKSYPYKFILIGDDGQKDPEEYARITKEYPRRIKAICIRSVSRKKRIEEVKKMLPKRKGFISQEGKECLEFVRKTIKNQH